MTKPIDSKKLRDCINAALALNAKTHEDDIADCELHERLETLTAREQEVLELVLKGYSNKEIGRQLNISFRTVERHRSRILLKTRADNTLQLANLIKDKRL